MDQNARCSATTCVMFVAGSGDAEQVDNQQHAMQKGDLDWKVPENEAIKAHRCDVTAVCMQYFSSE